MIEVVASEHADGRTWERPEMAPGTLDRQYFEAAAQGRLLIQRCPQCDHRQFPPKLICTACAGDPEWLEVSGAGVINTFTIVRRHGVEPFKSLAPFVLAMVDLPEGVRLMGNVTGIDVESTQIGQQVQAYALRIDDSMALPLWRSVD
ncbi:MAG: Zn-ribbon domain-containing OB-fold protein [Pseudomonadales bacterium]